MLLKEKDQAVDTPKIEYPLQTSHLIIRIRRLDPLILYNPMSYHILAVFLLQFLTPARNLVSLFFYTLLNLFLYLQFVLWALLYLNQK